MVRLTAVAVAACPRLRTRTVYVTGSRAAGLAGLAFGDERRGRQGVRPWLGAARLAAAGERQDESEESKG